MDNCEPAVKYAVNEFWCGIGIHLRLKAARNDGESPDTLIVTHPLNLTAGVRIATWSACRLAMSITSAILRKGKSPLPVMKTTAIALVRKISCSRPSSSLVRSVVAGPLSSTLSQCSSATSTTVVRISHSGRVVAIKIGKPTAELPIFITGVARIRNSAANEAPIVVLTCIASRMTPVP